MTKKGEYTQDIQDTFDPAEIAQTVFGLTVGLHVVEQYKQKKLKLQEDQRDRLAHDASFLEVQRNRWGENTINQALHEVGLPPIPWEQVDSLLQTYHAIV